MNRPVVRGVIQGAAGPLPAPPTIVLGPSLGTTTALWDAVVPALAEHCRVVRYDLPGHGLSPATRAPFDVADLADAVIDLVDASGGGAFHYAGISLAGAIGLQLALRHPDRLRSLAVICSSARIGTPAGWAERAARVRASGTASLVATSAERWFAPGFLERDPAPGSAALSALLDVDDESYALCCEALAGFDVTGEVHRIRTRTLCVSGELDLPMPAAEVQDLALRIDGAEYVMVAGAAHLPALERPRLIADLLTRSLELDHD